MTDIRVTQVTGEALTSVVSDPSARVTGVNAEVLTNVASSPVARTTSMAVEVLSSKATGGGGGSLAPITISINYVYEE